MGEAGDCSLEERGFVFEKGDVSSNGIKQGIRVRCRMAAAAGDGPLQLLQLPPGRTLHHLSRLTGLPRPPPHSHSPLCSHDKKKNHRERWIWKAREFELQRKK
ncbi:hypothetical protein SAY87_013782 [Trapa incisa]|uniref:Uncharacterized protein n=2 Tax=Trapa TaxID=22665 RepID=A0AAN7KF60_TRANT|nr:hypothetical protein SAY86_008659 [Trapa natans]KAK4764344.1 hypothetical protein SAY87_013782 [Trapa incisa]